MIILLSLGIAFINMVIRDFGWFPEVYGKIVFLILFFGGILRIFSPYLWSKGESRKEKEVSSFINQKGLNTNFETNALPEISPGMQPISIADFGNSGLDPAEMLQPLSVTEETTKSLVKSKDVG